MAGRAPRLAAILVALAAAFASPLYGKAAPTSTEAISERLLAETFDAIARQRFEQALEKVDALIRLNPNFRLAHLVRGDLLLARARPVTNIGAAPHAPAARVEGLRAEAVARLRAYRDRPPADGVPRYLLQLTPEQKHAVVVDTRRSRLYLYRNDGGTPRIAADYYISVGKNGAAKRREGDEKTPIGVYHVTSSVPRQKLTDFYGSGAFPINYPNEWDRRHGRNGHGIWLHGVPSDTYSRPPRSSNGCVVLSNADLDAVAERLQVGLTPVIISENVEWLSADQWARERREFQAQIEQWRADWESLNTDRYLKHYAQAFAAGADDLASWSGHKRKVNAGKQWIKVDVRNVSVFRSPGADELVVVTFEQDYRSSNLSNVMKKRQYWTREGGRWRIVYEGAA